MNITYLNEPLNFMTPDTSVIRASRAELERKLIARETLYLPALRQQLKTLNQRFHQLDDYARDMLASAPVGLQTQAISTLLGRMKDAAGLRPTPAADSVAEQYQTEIVDTLKESLDAMEEHAAALSERLEGLRVWTLSASTHFIADHDRRCASIQQALDALAKQCTEIERRKQPLSDAMKVYEDMTILDRWIPILEDVIKLRPSHPAITTLQAGVIGVENILRIASEAVKYGDLIKSRNLLQADLDSKYKQITDQKAQLRELSARSEALREVQDIGVPKQRYEEQVQKLVVTLQTFITLRERQAREPVADFARTYVAQADALSRGLRAVLKSW
jgi:DNA repair exonuclease SbcCD ATPase subunit